MKSSTPVTVTVCSALQIPGPVAVNVNDAGLTVPSVRSLDDSPSVTSRGRLARKPNGERRCAARLSRRCTHRTHRDARRLVIDVRDIHIGRIEGRCSRRPWMLPRPSRSCTQCRHRRGDHSTPVTVTVCAVLQMPVPDGVKVSDAGLTVPSVKSVDDSPIVTSPVGSVFSTTVNVAVPPASVVGPLAGGHRDPDRLVVHVRDRGVRRIEA